MGNCNLQGIVLKFQRISADHFNVKYQQTGVSQRTTTWICLRRDATPTFLLDEVIFDVTPPIGYSKKYIYLKSNVCLSVCLSVCISVCSSL